VTYVWSGKSWLYLAVVMDLYKRRVIGWSCSASPNSQLTTSALRVAYESRKHSTGVMFHSDQGCHYTCKTFRQKLWQYLVQQSMSDRANCWDNVAMGRFLEATKANGCPKNVTQLIFMLSTTLRLTCIIIIIDEDIVTTVTWLQHLLKSCKHLTIGTKIRDHFNSIYFECVERDHLKVDRVAPPLFIFELFSLRSLAKLRDRIL
jgi:hypothetical protein